MLNIAYINSNILENGQITYSRFDSSVRETFEGGWKRKGVTCRGIDSYSTDEFSACTIQ